MSKTSIQVKFPSLHNQWVLIILIGVKEGDKVSADYKQKNSAVIEKQIVIGGLRLAHIIRDIYGTAAVETEEATVDEVEAVKVSTFLQWKRLLLTAFYRFIYTISLNYIIYKKQYYK